MTRYSENKKWELDRVQYPCPAVNERVLLDFENRYCIRHEDPDKYHLDGQEWKDCTGVDNHPDCPVHLEQGGIVKGLRECPAHKKMQGEDYFTPTGT
ncbi:MAG TPA: hypothetical protein VMM38_01440 [Aridibacter sp.]|nr:hypothetical protein [Aridibacter sp.]